MKVVQLLLAALCLVPLASWSAPEPGDTDRPKIGLALSGGGARGTAHIGILKALEEMEIPVDYIAGTSMGAIIGGMYASGYRADEIRKIVIEMDWEGAMRDKPDRVLRTMRSKELEAQFLIPYRFGFNEGEVQFPLGLVEGQHLDQVFHHILMPAVGIHDFDQLPIPFRAVATDLVSGEEVVLASGSLPNALRASMSVPGVFAPVTIDGRMLVDGGMANNLPVSVVREMGADIVIAVDISSPLLTEEQLKSVFSVSEQLTNFLTRRTTELQIDLLRDGDVLIVPDLAEFGSADFSASEEIVGRGYEAAEQTRSSLSVLGGKGQAIDVEKSFKPSDTYIVNFVELENDSVLHDQIIQSRLAVETGRPLDLTALDESMDRIYSLDVFESVTYDLVQNDKGETGVVVQAEPRSWGPNYLQFGLELSSDFAGSSDFKLGAAYTRNALNRLGGELRIIGSLGREDELSFDFYQPIDTKADWFVQPEVFWSRENYRMWEEDINVAEFEISGWSGALGLGRNFGATNQLRLDYQFGRGDISMVTGDPDFLDQDHIEIGEFELRYIHDSLNSIWFPTAGMMHKLEYLYASESLGARADYQQAGGNGVLTWSSGKNTGIVNYELGYSVDDEATIERWYRLGGFGRLSGLAPDQLLGRHVALATLAYYRKLNDLELFSTYAGATLEAGNVWNLSDDIGLDDLRYSGSVFIGAESPLGPVYFALGYSDSDDLAAYFYIGNPFRISRFD